MVDREKVVAVLKRRFPGAAAEQVAAATNAIVGLDDEWVEVPLGRGDGDGHQPAPCADSCFLNDAARGGVRFRVFQRAEDNDHDR
jgi:hypothetical protein